MDLGWATALGTGALGAAARWTARKMDFVNRERAASNKVLGDISESGETTGSIANRLAEHPEMMTGDVNNQLIQRLTEAANINPHVSRNVADKVSERQYDELNRVLGKLEPVSTEEISEGIRAKMQRIADPLYAAANEQSVTPTPEMMSVLQTPAGQQAFKKAMQNLQNKGIPMEELTRADKNGNRVPDEFRLQLWDQVGRELGDKAEMFLKSGAKEDAAAFGRLKNVIYGDLEDQSKEFSRARKVWEAGSRYIDAEGAGKKAMRGTLDKAKRTYAKMTEPEKWHFGIGVIESLEDALRKKGNTDPLSKVFKPTKVQDTLSMVMGKERMGEFNKLLKNEKAMEKTYAAVRERGLLDKEDIYQAGITPANRQQLIYRLVREVIFRAGQKIRRRTAADTGEILMGRNPQQALDAYAGPSPIGTLAPTATGFAAANHPEQAETLPPRDRLLAPSTPQLPR